MISKCKVIYYLTLSGDNPVKEFIELLSKKQKAKIFRIFKLLEEYGFCSVIPHIKKLSGTPLWEIRILGEDSIRIIYATIQKNTLIMLHGFIKKSNKTPRKELDTASKRYSDVIKGY